SLGCTLNTLLPRIPQPGASGETSVLEADKGSVPRPPSGYQGGEGKGALMTQPKIVPHALPQGGRYRKTGPVYVYVVTQSVKLSL
ncbi:hypothetical protein Bpfe_025770, partial [Biomphalaria pfeifferi]